MPIFNLIHNLFKISFLYFSVINAAIVHDTTLAVMGILYSFKDSWKIKSIHTLEFLEDIILKIFNGNKFIEIDVFISFMLYTAKYKLLLWLSNILFYLV